MLASEKEARLAALLDLLPDHAVRKLAVVIECGAVFGGAMRDLVLAALRARASRAAERSTSLVRRLERAPLAVANALPLASFGSFGATRVSDFAHATPDEAIAEALAAARLMASPSSGEAADELEVRSAAQEEARGHLASYVDALTLELRADELSRRAVVDHQFEVAVALTEILLGSDAANRLRENWRHANLMH